MSGSEILTLLVFVGAVPLVWTVTFLLWRLHRAAPDIVVLRHAAFSAIAAALGVSVFALIFANNDLAIPVLTNEETRLITRSAVLVLSVIPAVYWLALYRRTT